MRNRVARYRAIAPVALTMAGGMILAGCGSGQPAPTTVTFPGAAAAAGSWAYPNGELDNTRVAAGSVISAANVGSLKEAWALKLAGTAAQGVSGAGSFAAAPVVVGGVVYIQDLDANVYAVSLATGQLRWWYQVNVPEKSGPGPDGVAVANGVVYGDTSTAVFALDAATGKVIWNDGSLLGSGQGSFEIQPTVASGRVYLASAYGSGPGGGVILALDAATGKKLWSFNTVAGAVAPGVRAGNIGSGGAWETPLIGTDGSVTFGTGNPYQTIGDASSLPEQQLYTDSEVNLSASTGKLNWYYQAVPNDFKDWDIQLSPIAATVNGVPAIIGGGKMGDVYAFSAATGALLWKTPVGAHDGADNDSLLLLQHKLTITLPYTTEPGALGGILSNMASAGGSVYVATINLPFKFTSLAQVNGNAAPAGQEPGEIEALNVNTGKVEWDRKVASVPLGAVTVSNDLIVTTLLSGELLALNRSTGAIVAERKLPATTNSPIAIAGNSVLVPAGAPGAKPGSASPQLVAYTVSG